jgi:hypothetical protein
VVFRHEADAAVQLSDAKSVVDFLANKVIYDGGTDFENLLLATAADVSLERELENST